MAVRRKVLRRSRGNDHRIVQPKDAHKVIRERERGEREREREREERDEWASRRKNLQTQVEEADSKDKKTDKYRSYKFCSAESNFSNIVENYATVKTLGTMTG